jgi:hypothetical protein
MKTRPFRISVIAAVSVLLVAVAACTPGYINTDDLGAPATAEEIRTRYAGNSIKYANELGGKPNVEAYFAPDGTYRMVAMDQPVFGEGTWRVHTTVGSLLLLQTTDHILEDGQVFSKPQNLSYAIYIQPDGTAIADQMGGGNFSQPKPTRGFQAQSRWQSLKRQAGL